MSEERCPCTWGMCDDGLAHVCCLERNHPTYNCLCGKCGMTGLLDPTQGGAMGDSRDNPKYQAAKARVNGANTDKKLVELVHEGSRADREMVLAALEEKYGKRRAKQKLESGALSAGAKPGLIRRITGW